MSLLDDCIESTWSHVLRYICLSSGFALFSAGFLFPTWKTDDFRPDTQSGLWQNCSRSMSDCHMFTFSEIPAWMHIVRVTELFAGFFYCWTLQRLYGINCYVKQSSTPSTNWRKLPTLACVSGVLGLCGMILFAFNDDHLKWGMTLMAGGSLLALVVGCFVFFFHDTVPRTEVFSDDNFFFYDFDPRTMYIMHI